MAQPSDISPVKRRKFGRARLAVVGLATSLAAVIALPNLAPFLGTFAILLMLWGLGFAPFNEMDQRQSDYESEPILWDDGFGTQ